jgi:predicted Zn-dependent protease
MIPAALFAATVTIAAPVTQAPELAALERAVAAKPEDVQSRQRLADAYLAADRPADAVAQLHRVARLAPKVPAVWYALGQAFNAVKQDALATFSGPADDPWRQLLTADALLSSDHLTDAFVLFREALGRLPSMITIHDSIARIYQRTGHAEWAAAERAKGRLAPAACGTRKALCEFRAARYRASLDAALRESDAESRYWRARAANELALAAFNTLETLPDSPERRTVRATMAQAEERYTDAVAELEAALRLAPRQAELAFELASAYYSARDYEAAISTIAPLLQAYPEDARVLSLEGRSLLQLRRADEAVPILERLAARHPNDLQVRLALGRAYLQSGNYAAAVPLIEEQLAGDNDGSLHVQLARACTALGLRDKAASLLARSEELQRADDARRAALARRAITAPK